MVEIERCYLWAITIQSEQRVRFLCSSDAVDVKKAGVIDPARVTKEAIQNAVSIAATAATMGALVVDVPEKEPAAPSMGGGMPGMGMM